MKNSTSPGILLADFQLINIEDKSFTGEAENYYQKLRALFYAIKDKIIKDRKKLHKENSDNQRKVMIESTRRNDLKEI